jgi:predicted Zn-ribbon and HTH transcriptional regulator
MRYKCANCGFVFFDDTSNPKCPKCGSNAIDLIISSKAIW